MIAKLAEHTTSGSGSNNSQSKFFTSKDAAALQKNHQNIKGNSSSGKKNEHPLVAAASSSSSSQSKRKRAKLLDQLLQTNWSKQSQQASNLMKLNKMLLVCDSNFLDEKSGESPLSLAISSAQINNASHQMLFTTISAQTQSLSAGGSSSNSSNCSLRNLQCQVPVHGLSRLELISLQQAGITELIQSKAPLIQRILLLLIKSGALIDFRNSDGRTPLHVAATKSNYWALKTLLDLGASTDYRDINGLTPLYYSITQKSDLKVTQLLLNHNSTNTNPTSHHYQQIGNGSVTAQLSDSSACTGTTDDHGWQEVHHTCKLGLDAHLESLIYHGCDINAKISGSGNTPLHVAAINDQLNCAKVLLMRGADKTITNNSHQTAHQVAVISGNMNLAEFIAQHNDSMMKPFRNSPAPTAAQIPNNNNNNNTASNGVAAASRPTDERPFAMFSSRSSANIKSDLQQQQQLPPQPPPPPPPMPPQSQALLQAQPQQRHMNPLSLDVFAPLTTNPPAAAAASSGGSSNTTNSSNQSLLSIGGNRNHGQFNAHVNNISPCLSQRSCATSNTTTSSGVCCDGDGNQSTEEQQQQHPKEHHLSNSHSQHSNVTIISIKNGAVDSTPGSCGKGSPRTGGGDDDDLRSSSDDVNSNGSSSSCADDLYSLMSEQRPLYAGTIVEAVSEYQSGDPSHLQLHRGDLIEVLNYTPELLNAGQLPRLANKPMIFGRRLSDSHIGLFPSFCVRRTKHKSSNQKLKTLRDVTNIDPSIMDETNMQWPIVHNENNRPLSESQSMASLDRRSESSFGSIKRDDMNRKRYCELNVILTKSNNGFGFVLRGAKIDPNLALSNCNSITTNDQSNIVGKTILDERVMAANNLISLQYLDEIEPTSAAHQAGLKRGDFLIAVNGQDVRRSSHEQVVHMIRQSGNQVQLTISTPILQSTAGEQQQQQLATNHQQQPNYMSRASTRSKPEPPRRDPTTTLTRNKTQRIKSMIVQPQRQVQNLFDADKPLPYAPYSEAPLSPSGSLNIGRSVSTQLAHFNSVQSLSSSSVVDTQSISSVSTLSADQQQGNQEIQAHLSEGQKATPTHSSSSTTTLTTIAGVKPRTPPKPSLSQLPSSGSQQAIYQPAVITTNKRSSTSSTLSPQTSPKVEPSGKVSPSMPPPPPPPPLPNFSLVSPVKLPTNCNRLIERRTSAPSNQSLQESINQSRLLRKRESIASIGQHSPSDATELGAVAAACAAAANSRRLRQQQQQQMQLQASREDNRTDEAPPKAQDTPVIKENTPVNAPTKDCIEEKESNEVETANGTEKISTELTQMPIESSSKSLPNRQVATASLGRKSSAQIIQQPKQVMSQTLRARTKQRPSILDYNETPPPPPPLPSTPVIEFKQAALQQAPYDDTSIQLNNHHHHHRIHNHGPTEQIDLDRQQAYSRRSRDEANMSLNNKEEFIKKQQQQHHHHHQQELIKQQLRQQQLLQQQQLKMQQHIQLQHQKCCINASLPHEHHHGTMRYSSNSTPRAQHEYTQQVFDRLQIKQQHPIIQQQLQMQQQQQQQQQPQAMIVNKASAHHHHHHHHNHNHSHHKHHHPTNYADSSTMPANLQHQHQHQLHHHHHHHQTPNDHLQQNIYQQHPLHVQAPIMLNQSHHNHVQARAALDQRTQQQQQYYQQQQILSDRYNPVVYTAESYSSMKSRDN